MNRIFSTFILGMAATSLIAAVMTVFGASAQNADVKPSADCRVTALNPRGSVIYDSEVFRIQLAEKAESLLPDKQQTDFSRALYGHAWLFGSANGELEIALHFGKNLNIASIPSNRVVSAAGHFAGPVEFTYRTANQNVIKVECQVVK